MIVEQMHACVIHIWLIIFVRVCPYREDVCANKDLACTDVHMCTQLYDCSCMSSHGNMGHSYEYIIPALMKVTITKAETECVHNT